MDVAPTYAALAVALNLPPNFVPYRDAVVPPGDPLPPEQLNRAATFLELDPDLLKELHAARSQVHSDPAMSTLLRLARAAIWSRPGKRLDWPLLPQTSPAGRLFYFLVFLAMFPDTLALHAARGISPTISHATLLDLPRWAQKARQRHGAYATLTPRWLARAFTGTEYRLGRLQFEMRSFYLPALAVAPGLTLAAGDSILSVHIPDGPPLTDAAVDDAFSQATTFCPRHFPEFRYRALACDSWMMCPELLDVLPATSNIARFQKRFHTFRVPNATDEGIMDYLFDHPASRDALPRKTSLQRAVADAMAAGKTFPDALGLIIAADGAAIAAGYKDSP